MTTTPADLLGQSFLPGHDLVVQLDLPLARQAIELQISIGEDVRALLVPLKWHTQPAALLSLVFDGDDLHRACRAFAAWCMGMSCEYAHADDRGLLTTAQARIQQGADARALAAWCSRFDKLARERHVAALAARQHDDPYCRAALDARILTQRHVDAVSVGRWATDADAAIAATMAAHCVREAGPPKSPSIIARQDRHLLDIVCAQLE